MTRLVLKHGDVTHQGDVVIVPRPHLSGVIPNTTPIPRENGRIILAHGEVTGHAHAIECETAEWFSTEDGKRFLRLVEPASIQHEEHGAFELEAGTYEIRIEREYSPEAIRNVAD